MAWQPSQLGWKNSTSCGLPVLASSATSLAWYQTLSAFAAALWLAGSLACRLFQTKTPAATEKTATRASATIRFMSRSGLGFGDASRGAPRPADGTGQRTREQRDQGHPASVVQPAQGARGVLPSDLRHTFDLYAKSRVEPRAADR